MTRGVRLPHTSGSPRDGDAADKEGEPGGVPALRVSSGFERPSWSGRVRPLSTTSRGGVRVAPEAGSAAGGGGGGGGGVYRGRESSGDLIHFTPAGLSSRQGKFGWDNSNEPFPSSAVGSEGAVAAASGGDGSGARGGASRALEGPLQFDRRSLNGGEFPPEATADQLTIKRLVTADQPPS